jgi:hypothetical protein
MSALMRFDPFRDFDRIAEQMMLGASSCSERTWTPTTSRRTTRTEF